MQTVFGRKGSQAVRLLSLGAMVFVFGGCPSPQDWMNDLGMDLEFEKTNYADLEKLAENESPGPALGDAYVQWMNSVKRLQNRLGELAKSVNSRAGKKDDPWKDANLATRLNELERRLREDFFDRNIRLELPLPSWQESELRDEKTQLVKAWVLLGQAYQELFRSGQAQVLFDAEIKVMLDISWYDTKPDCVHMVEMMTMAAPHSDWCSRAAKNYCDHQADRACIQDLLLRNLPTLAIDGCMTVQGSAGSREMGEWEVEAAFLRQIANCKSPTKVSQW